MKIFKIDISSLIFFILIIFPFYAFSDSAFDNNFYTNVKYFLRLILILILLTNIKKIRFFAFKNFSAFQYYIVFIFFALISVIFSYEKGYSFIKFGETSLILFLSIYLVNTKTTSINDIPKLIFQLCFIYIIGFFILGNTIYPSLYRSMGFEGQLRLGGGIINPNLLAYSFLAIILSIQFLKTKLNSIFISCFQLLAIYLLFLTYSRSALILFAILLLYRLISKNKLFLIILFPLIIFLQINSEIIISFLERGDGLESLITLSGRIPVWVELVEKYDFSIYSFFGYGFQMLSSSGMGIKIGAWGSNSLTELTMAHNNILQVLYGMGFIGLLVMLLILFRWKREIDMFKNSNIGIFFSSFYWLILVFSLVEFGVFGTPNFLILIFSILIFSLHKYVRPEIN